MLQQLQLQARNTSTALTEKMGPPTPSVMSMSQVRPHACLLARYPTWEATRHAVQEVARQQRCEASHRSCCPLVQKALPGYQAQPTCCCWTQHQLCRGQQALDHTAAELSHLLLVQPTSNNTSPLPDCLVCCVLLLTGYACL